MSTPRAAESPTFPRPFALTVAVALLTGAGVVLMGVGVGVIAQMHGRFSIGVGSMLVLYGLLVTAIAWMGWKRHPLAFGLMVSATVLHILVVGSTANGSKVWWLWLVEIPLVATIVCLMVPSTRRLLGHGPSHDEASDQA